MTYVIKSLQLGSVVSVNHRVPSAPLLQMNLYRPRVAEVRQAIDLRRKLLGHVLFSVGDNPDLVHMFLSGSTGFVFPPKEAGTVSREQGPT
jgi:hypothetical protein